MDTYTPVRQIINPDQSECQGKEGSAVLSESMQEMVQSNQRVRPKPSSRDFLKTPVIPEHGQSQEQTVSPAKQEHCFAPFGQSLKIRDFLEH